MDNGAHPRDLQWSTFQRRRCPELSQRAWVHRAAWFTLSCLLQTPQCLSESKCFANPMSDFLSRRVSARSPTRLEAHPQGWKGGACTGQPPPSSFPTPKAGISGMGRWSTPSSFSKAGMGRAGKTSATFLSSIPEPQALDGGRTSAVLSALTL